MATFAKATFSAANYAAARPTYPQTLYRQILAYHRGPRDLLLDLGCGPGIVTRALSPSFKRALGTDFSAGMIAQAQKQAIEGREELNTLGAGELEFRQSGAEDCSFLGQGEVDCVTVAQAVHWFDFAKWWEEMSRIVRPQGTVAIWGLADPSMIGFPKATEVLMHFAYGDEEGTLMGPYWPQPGRTILQEGLEVVVPPEGAWEDVKRLRYHPSPEGPGKGSGELLVARDTKVGEMKAYVRSWSSYHGWTERWPDQKAREAGGKGDIVDVMFEEMAKHEPALAKDETPVRLEWPTTFILARRKQS